MTTTMRPALGSFAYTWGVGVAGAMPARPLGPLDLVDEAAALGVPVLQLADNIRIEPAAVGALHERAVAREVELELGARGLTAASLDAQVELAQALDARILRFVVDAPGHEPPADTVVALLRARLDALDRVDVTVALENHDRFPARELARIVDAVDSPRVGVCLDTVNSIGSGEGLDAVLAVLAPRTVNLHVKDFTITRRAHGMGFVVAGARLGDGMLDLDAVLDAVDRHGRCTSAVLEQWAPAAPDPEDAAALEREWAHTGIDLLRSALDARRHDLTHEGATST